MDDRNQKPLVKTYCGGKPNYCTPEGREDIIKMAREAGAGEPESLYGRTDYIVMTRSEVERFADLVRAAEREACADKTGEFARKWWSLHCASNKHMETTRKAHDDFCALQAAIRARGNT